MDNNVYSYMQKRGNCGKPLHLMETKTVYYCGNLPDPSSDKKRKFNPEGLHVKRNPNFINLSNIPEISENIVNTERVNMDHKKMFHYEGGWPLEVDKVDEKSRNNHIKKRLEKTQEGADIFTDSCRKMCKNVKEVIKMNKQIDMFEEYFEGEVSDHNIEKLSLKTLMLFKDPSKDNKRSINKISWHPDGPRKLAGAYCVMRFQKQPLNMDLRVFPLLPSPTSGTSKTPTVPAIPSPRLLL